MVNVSNSSWTVPGTTFPSTYATPSFISAQGNLVLALGFDVTPEVFNGSTFSAITSTQQPSQSYPSWTANTTYQFGTVIIPSPANGFIYTATNNFGIQGSGTSGASQPTFPTTIGATVTDHNIVWKCTAKTGSTPSSTSFPPTGATSLFYHGGFLFAWGTSATYQSDGLNGPDALMQSDLNNFNSWNPVNTTFVGKGDGTLPRGGGVMTVSETGILATPQLVLFKDTDTYILNGFFPTFSLNKAPNGVGCVAPGSVQFLAGFGLMRLSYRGIAVFDGQNDSVDQWTDPIHVYLDGDDDSGIVPIDWSNANLSMSAQFDNPRMYLLAVPLVGSNGALTRIFAYDVALNAWAVLNPPTPIAAMGYIPQNALAQRSFIGGFSDGAIYSLGSANCTWNGASVAWSFRTPELGEANTPSYVRRLSLRGQASAEFTGNPALSSATLNYQDKNGVVQTKPLAVPASAGLTRSMDVDVTMLSANADISGTGPAVIEGIDYHYTPKPPSRIGGSFA